MLIRAFHGKLGYFPVSDNQKIAGEAAHFLSVFTGGVKTIASTDFEVKLYFTDKMKKKKQVVENFSPFFSLPFLIFSHS